MVLCSTSHIAITGKDKAESYVKTLAIGSIMTVYEQLMQIDY